MDQSGIKKWIAIAAILGIAVTILVVHLVGRTAPKVGHTQSRSGHTKGHTTAPAPQQEGSPAAPLDKKWQAILSEINVGVDFGNFDLASNRKRAVYKDLMLPRDYGYATWSGLEERLRRNLMQQLVDLAMVHRAQGQVQKARAAAQEALSIVLAYSAPADPGVANWWQNAPETYTVDAIVTKSLEERLRSALARGWFGSAAFCYISLLPPGTSRKDDPAEFSLLVAPKPKTAHGVRWLLAARRRMSRGDRAGGAEAARMAFNHLHRSAEKLITNARARPLDIFLAYGNHYIGGDPSIRGFPWGWLSVDFVLGRLSIYIAEAAKLPPNSDATISQANKMKARIDGLLRERKKTGKEGMPHWTTQRALTTVPT